MIYAHNDTGTTAFQFYIGRNRATSGIITTSFDNVLDVRVRPGQRLSLYTTLVGSGSVSLLSNGSTTFTLDHHAALVLGAGDQASDGSLNTSNTFSGGVSVGTLSFLLPGESSVVDGGGSMVSGPVGTGTLAIGGTTTDTARIGAIRSGVLTSGAAVTLHNPVVINSNGLQTVGGIDMTRAGPVTVSAGSIGISVSPAVKGLTAKHTLTMSGTISATDGFEKRGYGTLLLSGNNSSALAGTINVTNGVLLLGADGALGTTGSGTADMTTVNGGTLKFADNLSYTGAELVQIRGHGSSALNGALVGGTSNAATFAGNVELTGSATINSAAGLFVGGPVTSAATYTLVKNGAGVLSTARGAGRRHRWIRHAVD